MQFQVNCNLSCDYFSPNITMFYFNIFQCSADRSGVTPHPIYLQVFGKGGKMTAI
uniref:Uncharacterized protein n=1 Tax=Anguilla anguilla TaxID=7936 RepID=A0A0E9U5Y8_ANGAN